MEKMVEVERATQDELRQDLKSLFQGAIRLTLEMVLEEELKAMVGARRFERVGSRKGHRNGTYLRRLLTSLGQIDVTVPRSREGGSPADVMGRYQRRSEEVDAMMVEAYVSGVSQRKMGDVTEALMGERVGRSTVSRVAKRLDEGVQTLRSAPIEGAHPYLYLDATFLDARWARKVENVSALVAYPPVGQWALSDCGLERTSLPGSHASRTEGGRQGSLTEASRSFLSLLHTTRDLTSKIRFIVGSTEAIGLTGCATAAGHPELVGAPRATPGAWSQRRPARDRG